jgi:hypothetical protein
MNSEQINILLKAWETYQNLSKGLGENCWKVRTVGIGFWSAIIAYGYQHSDKNVYKFSLLIIFMFFVIEAGIRQLQYEYISKSIEIEKSINDFLAGDEISLPSNGISTNIDIPSFVDFLLLFCLKRWLFWFPYLVLTTLTIILIRFI